MIFQEYDCPQGADQDLHGEEIAVMGELVHCSYCGLYHIAGKDGPDQTAVLQSNGKIEWRGLPKDKTEKKAWIEEAAKNSY